MAIRMATAVAAMALAAACGRKDVNAGERVPKPFASNEENARRGREAGPFDAGEVVGAGGIAPGARGGGPTGGYEVVYGRPGRVASDLQPNALATSPIGATGAGPLGGGTTGTGPHAGPTAGGTTGRGAYGGGLEGAGSASGIGAQSSEGAPPPPAGPGGLAPATGPSGAHEPARFVYGRIASLRGDALELATGRETVTLRLSPGARITSRGWALERDDIRPGQEVRASLAGSAGPVVALEVTAPTPLGQ